ncbi:MAG: hypothetical protein RJA36_3947 [Pseudomonadota bacterium]|jgi:hypothetical protein
MEQIERLAHYAGLAEEAQQELAPYTEALKRHDWNYEFADDSRAWRAGLEQRKQLMAMRARLDPSGAIWNRFAPAAHRVPA